MYVPVDHDKPRHGTGWQVVRVVLAVAATLFALLALVGEDPTTAAVSAGVAVLSAASFVRSRRMRAAGDTDRP